MSKLICAALAAAFSVLLLSGCGMDTEAEGWSASAMARETAGEVSGLVELSPGSAEYVNCVEVRYGLDPETIEDGAVLAASGASAEECAVFRFASEDAAREAEASLQSYITARTSDFTGYMPEEAELAASGRTEVRGAWCALVILPDVDDALERFDTCFTREPPASTSGDIYDPAQTSAAPETTGWVYDEERIISAWRSGSYSGLSEYDLAILEEVEHVLTEVAPDTLSAYERELAIHDYIIDTARYDSETLSILHALTLDPNNTNPYGTLISGRAVCLGYSSTFQLFMDLIGVECITVHGEGNASRDEHAWNQVKLDGEWYCVDVTWDDPTGLGSVSDRLEHKYFNVTSEYMRQTFHYWDPSDVPEATGTKYAWDS